MSTNASIHRVMMLSSDFVWHSNEKLKRANHSLERTQPQRDFMYDVEVLRRSARGRWAAIRNVSMVFGHRICEFSVYGPSI